MGAADNKTLRTHCGKCGKELVTFVDSDVSARKTWPLVGDKDGAIRMKKDVIGGIEGIPGR